MQLASMCMFLLASCTRLVSGFMHAWCVIYLARPKQARFILGSCILLLEGPCLCMAIHGLLLMLASTMGACTCQIMHMYRSIYLILKRLQACNYLSIASPSERIREPSRFTIYLVLIHIHVMAIDVMQCSGKQQEEFRLGSNCCI